jgi:cytochrome c biogenesis factor
MIRAGEFSLWIALLAAAWGAALSVAGGVSRRRELAASGAMGVHVAAAALVLSCAGLATALWQSDFTLRYVASFTAANLPDAYRLSALWAGPAGSLLCSATLLGMVASAAIAVGRRSQGVLAPWVAATLGLLLAFFIALLVFGPSPFERLPFPPPEGRGLDPQLQNPAMALHPPLLMLGYAVSAMPFALVIAGLVTRRLDVTWLLAVRRWALRAWMVLTVGITVGMWWAYREVRWRGYWSWDAMEVAAALPWLVAGALAYAIPRRSALAARRGWSVALGSLTYLVVIGGAFMARSGVVPTAHGFAVSAVGETFAWLGAAVIVVIGALGYRARSTFGDPGVAGAGAEDAGMPAGRAARHVLLAGAGLFVLGLAGAAFNRRYTTELGDGESFRARDALGREWLFTSQGASRYQRENRAVIAVALLPSLAGRRQPFIKPEQRQFFDSEEREIGEPSARAAVQSTALQDVYVVLDDVRESRARLEIGFRPLVSFIWMGGVLMAIGGLLTLAAEPAGQFPPGEQVPETPARDLDREAEEAITRWRARTLNCPNCGLRPEGDAAFCSNCGFPLEEL